MPIPPYPRPKPISAPGLTSGATSTPVVPPVAATPSVPTQPEPPLKQRAATPISSTNSVPTGTMITVPSAPSSGAVPSVTTGGMEKAPVVGANTVNKWIDPGFMLGILSCLTGVVTAIMDVLPSSGPIDWRVTWPKLFLAVIGAVGSYIRHRTNTVTK